MDIPSEIIIGYNIESKSQIEEWLKNKKNGKVSIVIPLKGNKKHMLDICIKNKLSYHLTNIYKKYL